MKSQSRDAASPEERLEHRAKGVGYATIARINPVEINSLSLPFLLKIIVLTIFLPVELSFYAFGLRLTLTRLILLSIVPLLLFKFFRRVSTGRYRFVLADLFFPVTGLWLIYAPSNVSGLLDGLNHAGPEVLEFCAAFMSTRVLLRNHGDAFRFANLLSRVIAVVAVIGLIDSLTGTYFTHNLSRQLSGYVGSNINDWTDAYRLGLLRAAGPIEHPILFSLICSVGLIIAVSAPISFRKLVTAACLLGIVFSFSSAPVQCAALGICLIIYGRLMAGISFRWLALIATLTAGVALAFMVSSSPLGFIISHLIYDAASGYYRYWTWERTIFYVSQSPWFGLGYSVPPDDINHSIDSLWLVLSIHAGVPGAVFTFLALVGSASLPTSGRNVKLSENESKLGTALGIVIFIIIYIAFTVHIWGSAWVLAGLLAGARAHLGELGRLSARPEIG